LDAKVLRRVTLITVAWLRIAEAIVTTTFISLGLGAGGNTPLKLLQERKEYLCVPS